MNVIFSIWSCFCILNVKIVVTFAGNCAVSEILPGSQYEMFKCDSFRADQMNIELQKKLNEKFNGKMRSTGLHLRHIHFVKSENIIYRIPTGWFTVNVSLTYLHLSDLNIFAIEKDAFNGNSFVNLRELSISDTAISSLNSGIFHGLFSLTILTLTNSKVHFFAPNTLRTLPVLRQFTMTRCVKQEISLDNLFGMAKLEHLQKVQVSKCCLNRSITNLTFSGLTNIIELNLMSNHIEEIGSKSFNSIFKTLKYLYLGKNNLKTARNLFFPKMATNVQIFLEENEWHCDCDMENVRRLILNAKFMKFNDVICQTPLAMNQIVLNTYKKTLCSKLTMLLKTKAPIILVVPTEATNTKESEGNETIAVAPESEESFEDLPMNTTCPVQCDVSNEEFVKHSMDYVTFTKLSVHIFPFRYKDGKLMLFTSEKSKDFVYVGFEQCTPYRKYKQISRCIGNSEGTERKVEITLKLNQSYRFCQMEKSDITIKPFECVSIYSQTKDQQEIEETEQSTCWIMREQKTIAIIGFIVLAICMPFVGILVAIILAKFFPKRIRGIQHNETIASIPKQVVRIDSTNQFRSSDKPIRRRIITHNRDDPMNLASTPIETDLYETSGYISFGDVPPPLPARNKHLKLDCCSSDNCECYCEL